MANQPPEPREPTENGPADPGRQDWRKITMETVNLILNLVLVVQSFRGR